MSKLTKNISRHEVACKCGCGLDTIDYLTLEIVQSTCNYFGNILYVDMKINITSGFRCLEYNRKIGSKDTSQHVVGRALDFYLYYYRKDNRLILPPHRIYDYLDSLYPDKFGIGLYETFTHFDTKTGIARKW